MHFLLQSVGGRDLLTNVNFYFIFFIFFERGLSHMAMSNLTLWPVPSATH